MSYLFIAIVWTNHHYLMRYATEANLRLLWFNFVHLFSRSLLPLSTAWMANSELAPQPVRSCLDLTAVSGVSELLGREAVMQKVSFRKADVEGFNIFYREAGPTDAQPLLLLHGFPSASHMFRDLVPGASFRLVRNSKVQWPCNDRRPRSTTWASMIFGYYNRGRKRT